VSPLPRRLRVTRYGTPLREGGSLPAIVEAEDLGLYVMKFRGAGQNVRALIAELIGGRLALALGLLVPECVMLDLDAAIARNEPHDEIRVLLKASVGLNMGLDYLPGDCAAALRALRVHRGCNGVRVDQLFLVDAHRHRHRRTPAAERGGPT
jgi:hypothetical protein